jgi:hypothetical protein
VFCGGGGAAGKCGLAPGGGLGGLVVVAVAACARLASALGGGGVAGKCGLAPGGDVDGACGGGTDDGGRGVGAGGRLESRGAVVGLVGKLDGG